MTPPEIESAEDAIDFALRILDALDDGYEEREPVNTGELALMIEARDAAIAARARAEALDDAAYTIHTWVKAFCACDECCMLRKIAEQVLQCKGPEKGGT